MDVSLSELRELVMDREAWCAWATELNWTDTNLQIYFKISFITDPLNQS